MSTSSMLQNVKTLLKLQFANTSKIHSKRQMYICLAFFQAPLTLFIAQATAAWDPVQWHNAKGLTHLAVFRTIKSTTKLHHSLIWCCQAFVFFPTKGKQSSNSLQTVTNNVTSTQPPIIPENSGKTTENLPVGRTIYGPFSLAMAILEDHSVRLAIAF